MLIRSTALILLLLFCSFANAGETGSGQITPAALVKEIGHDKPLVIIDVREPALFRAGHIPGAVNLPWPGVKKSAQELLKPDQKIVFICHSGPMGDAMVDKLSAKGYQDVRNLTGGMDAWQGAVER